MDENHVGALDNHVAVDEVELTTLPEEIGTSMIRENSSDGSGTDKVLSVGIVTNTVVTMSESLSIAQYGIGRASSNSMMLKLR